MSDTIGQKQDFYSFFLEKQNSLILHPYYVKSSNAVTSFLTSDELVSKATYIMTEDPGSINVAAGKDLSSRIYLKYEYDRNLAKILANECIILVDSLTLFRMADLASKMTSRNKNCIVIIFTSVFFRSGDLEYFNRYYLQYGLVSYQMSSRNPNIRYELQHLPPDSLDKTSIDTSNYTSNNSPPRNYPIFTRNGIVVDTKDFPDIDKGEGGWLYEGFLSDVSTYFPKISRLLTILISQYEHRHIVYTRYRDKNGLDLIDTLLNYLNLPHTIVYENDDHNEQTGKISTFNNSDHSILLTNTIPRGEITNSTHIHFVDGLDYIDYQGFINNNCRNCLWKTFTPSEYVIYFYVHTPDDEKSYTKLAARIEANEGKFHELIEQSVHIIFDAEKDLCIRK